MSYYDDDGGTDPALVHQSQRLSVDMDCFPSTEMGHGSSKSSTQVCTMRTRSHQHWWQLQSVVLYAVRHNQINYKAGETPIYLYVYLKVQSCSSQQTKSHLQASDYGLPVLFASLPPCQAPRNGLLYKSGRCFHSLGREEGRVLSQPEGHST